jgi:hypothetical protein
MSYLRQNNIFERSGIGAYDQTGDWSWEFFPPPYDAIGPKNPVAMPAPIILTPNGPLRPGGLSGCGCGGKCGGCGHKHGVGLFDSTDFSTWGIGEYAAIGLGIYMLGSIMGDFGRAKKKVGKIRRRSKRVATA